MHASWSMEKMSLKYPPNVDNHLLYVSYVFAKHGQLIHGNQINVPQCIVTFICDLFLDSGGIYMGHKNCQDVKMTKNESNLF